jgi:hypothetical protein
MTCLSGSWLFHKPLCLVTGQIKVKKKIYTITLLHKGQKASETLAPKKSINLSKISTKGLNYNFKGRTKKNISLDIYIFLQSNKIF